MAIYKRLFKHWTPEKRRRQTNVTPKRGRLIAREISWHRFNWTTGKDEKTTPEHFLIVDVVMDEYSCCKFYHPENKTVQNLTG